VRERLVHRDPAHGRRVLADGSRLPARHVSLPNPDPNSPADSEAPQLTVDASGRARITWLQATDADAALRVNTTVIDAAGAPDVVHTLIPPGENIDSLGAGANDAGAGVIAWSDDGGLEAWYLDANGAAVNVGTLRPAAADHFQAAPTIAVDAAGIATIAWNDVAIGAARTTVEARRLGPTGPPGTLHELDTWSQTINQPVAVDVHPASGRATIVWTHFPDAGFAPESVRGAHLGANDVLEPFPQAVAFDEAGDPDVVAARIPAGAAPEPEETLAAHITAPTSPAVVADRDGSALVAFSYGDGGDDFVRAAHFDGEPPVVSRFGAPARGLVGQEL